MKKGTPTRQIIEGKYSPSMDYIRRKMELTHMDFRGKKTPTALGS
jgi:hypothetical protein